jgi:hypothetical protein
MPHRSRRRAEGYFFLQALVLPLLILEISLECRGLIQQVDELILDLFVFGRRSLKVTIET